MKTASRSGPSLRSPLFIACVLVLGAAAAAMGPGIDALISHYSKLPIDIRRRLRDLDVARLPSYRRMPDAPGLIDLLQSSDIGTDEYLGFLFQERDAPSIDPARSMLLFVTYYSDPRETIPHTPEVCYRQAGLTVSDIHSVTIETPALAPEMPSVDALQLDIDDGRMAVVYVLVCNGRIYDSREKARLAIGFPGDRRIYFSKVEVSATCGSDDYETTARRCRALLAEALPVLIQDHFPTRAQLESE